MLSSGTRFQQDIKGNIRDARTKSQPIFSTEGGLATLDSRKVINAGQRGRNYRDKKKCGILGNGPRKGRPQTGTMDLRKKKPNVKEGGAMTSIRG